MTTLDGWKWPLGVFAVCLAMMTPLPAQTLTTLFSFKGSDGNYPQAPLVQGIDGSLYGTTQAGGTNVSNCVNGGCGTVFAITPAGTLRTLYDFCVLSNCNDGTYPSAGLVLTEDGSFYGTTYGGGTIKGDCNNDGCGTVFVITPAGAPSTVYNFCSQTDCADGAGPDAGLVQAPEGNFYGTVAYGGGAADGGIVFRMTPTGALTTLYSFCSQLNCSDGELPLAPLVQGTDRNFYGTTSGGGISNNQPPCNTSGCGTIFKITPSGTFTTLYSFCSQPNCTDGANPSGGLIQGSDGALYGTTALGGTYAYGTVFKITPQGTFRTLHNFSGGDGARPTAGLTQATDGNLYGITGYGGRYYSVDQHLYGGTAFTITPRGVFTLLYSFCAQTDCADGQVPYAGLMQSTNGLIYGTTFFGGANSSCSNRCGTMFTLNMGLGPFVTFVRAAGKVGQTGGILGQGFTGTTNVTLNGIPAAFTVRSDTYLTATVPNGATTGYITVTTPSGTLTSNVPFRVIQ